MALTRKMLKAMGIEDEKIDQIIEAHTDTVNALKDERDTFRADAEKLADVQKELDGLKEKIAKNGDEEMVSKAEYDKMKKAYDDFKADITAKETKAAKEKAVRAYFESRNITGKNLEIAMRGSSKEIDAVELEDGKIKDAAALDALISGDFSGLVSTTTTIGANTANPPANNGSSAPSKEDILKIKDTTERQRAWADYLLTQKGK